jgi:hypothetical protein
VFSFRHVGGLTVSVWLMINPEMTKKISTPAGKIVLSGEGRIGRSHVGPKRYRMSDKDAHGSNATSGLDPMQAARILILHKRALRCSSDEDAAPVVTPQT